MHKSTTVAVPFRVIQQLQGLLIELEPLVSPYQPAFLARMYRARASDLEGKGKRLAEVKQRFQRSA